MKLKNADWEDIHPEDIPDSLILDHPLVNDLTASLNLKDFKVPLVIPNKVLMDEGKWNNHYYSAESIKKALENTDWSDREKRSLFLDHEDLKASEWVGEVENIRMEGKKLVGDLVIHDFNLAVKLLSGKPKFGISPKVRGKTDINTREMFDFVFDNFSIVINPAVKTAYINNMEVSDKMAEEEESATEETPSEEEKTEEQAEEETEEETSEEGSSEESSEVSESLAKKKKKYPYPYKQAEKKKKKYPYPYEQSDEDDELSAYTDFVKQKRKEGWSFAKIAKAWKAQKKQKELEELKEEFEVNESMIKGLEAFLAELKKKREKYKYPEVKDSEFKELKDTVQKMQSTIEKLLDTPDKRSVKAESEQSLQERIKEIERDPDAAMRKWMRETCGGVTA